MEQLIQKTDRLKLLLTDYPAEENQRLLAHFPSSSVEFTLDKFSLAESFAQLFAKLFVQNPSKKFFELPHAIEVRKINGLEADLLKHSKLIGRVNFFNLQEQVSKITYFYPETEQIRKEIFYNLDGQKTYENIYDQNQLIRQDHFVNHQLIMSSDLVVGSFIFYDGSQIWNLANLDQLLHFLLDQHFKLDEILINRMGNAWLLVNDFKQTKTHLFIQENFSEIPYNLQYVLDGHSSVKHVSFEQKTNYLWLKSQNIQTNIQID